MSIVLVGSTSGSVTLQEPAVAGTTVLDLPATSGTILTTGSSGQVIPKAALPTGSVLQVVSQQAPASYTSTSSALTLLTQSFTPTSATSKVLALMDVVAERTGGGGSGNYIFVNLRRNGTALQTNAFGNALGYQLSNGARSVGAHTYLDSPATTSAISYTLVGDFSVSGNVQWDLYVLQLTLLEIAA
jgi:hypothetical protein